MKKLTTFLMLAATLCTHAQTYPEPDFANIPMWYDGTALKSFERLPPNQGSRMTGMASAEMLIFFAGETSSVKFPLGKLPPIIVKMNSPTEDPASSVNLGKMQVNRHKHQREYIMGKGGLGGSKTTVSTIMVDFKKLGNGMYQVIPTAPLEAGEYCFNIGKNGFLFAVTDPNEPRGENARPHGPQDPLGRAITKAIDEKKARDKAKAEAENKQQ